MVQTWCISKVATFRFYHYFSLLLFSFLLLSTFHPKAKATTQSILGKASLVL